MVDIKFKSEQEVKAAEASAVALSAVPVMQRVPSWGESGAGFLRDRVVNLLLNEGISLWGTDKFVRGNWKKYCDRWSQALAKRFNGKVEDYRGLLLTLILNQGGNILVIPMKILENFKAPIVKVFNHIADKFSRHKLTPEEIKARDEEVAAHLAQEPKTTWKSLIGARVFTTVFNMGLNGLFLKGERTEKLEKISGDFVGGLVKVPNVGFLNRLADNEMFKGISRLLMLETFYCSITSYGMEFLDKIFSGKRKSSKLRFVEKPAGEKINDAAPAVPPALSQGDSPGYVSRLAADKSSGKAENAAAPLSLEKKYKNKTILPAESYTTEAARKAQDPNYHMAT